MKKTSRVSKSVWCAAMAAIPTVQVMAAAIAVAFSVPLLAQTAVRVQTVIETTALAPENDIVNFGQALIPDMVADPSIVDIDGTFYCYATKWRSEV